MKKDGMSYVIFIGATAGREREGDGGWKWERVELENHQLKTKKKLYILNNTNYNGAGVLRDEIS